MRCWVGEWVGGWVGETYLFREEAEGEFVQAGEEDEVANGWVGG